MLTERTVAEVVTRAVVSTRPGAPLREAARLMRDAEVHRILVMEDGE
ncbi:MAG: CBS domain-containing protein, partial [Gemmatimonadetes bacterium]|nr:CBS domain-containing protein [Gemmatimonadota bacterium]NIR34698.1 CBS domain-containing protein [Actinomycetota bacterium]NIT96604.1 CBS domain-containing protein [Actinomycetota bacterium]NIU64142.1 CBS domain-containing protein [Actinomycetota bacterium]NIV56771.1 CBS domain-containing protein [Actinomycetota bacterium]